MAVFTLIIALVVYKLEQLRDFFGISLSSKMLQKCVFKQMPMTFLLFIIGSVDSSHGTHTVEQAPFNLGFITVYATDNRSSEGLYMPMFTSMTA